MKWTDIRRLVVGDKIAFVEYRRKIQTTSGWVTFTGPKHIGTIIHVTVAGGIKVKDSNGFLRWTSYHLVVGFPMRPAAPSRRTQRTSGAWE